ncbi:MAG: triphosphoribosyl-dephospho-CoA synthase, partial [Halobacteriota archaeon]
MYDPDFIAGCAELAMLLEVSATPKPGNVDRTHDFEDVTYEHFLASAVGTFPVFKKAASARHGIGGLILDAV